MCLQVFKLCLIFSFFVLIQGESYECGKVMKPRDNRIVRGEVIGYVKYPWFAPLYLAANLKQLVCGGSLIGKRHVLTAAHCFKPYFAAAKAGDIKLENLYVVQLGIDNSCYTDSKIQTYATLKVYIYKEYYSDLLYSDIAVLFLDNVVNDFVPICLPPARYESNNRTNLQASIVGLGKELSSAWRLPCQVKEAEVVIQADATCRQFLNNYKENGSRLHDAFCAGDDHGTDTCQGDSGGPLQVSMGDNQVMVLGITSFGFGCGKKETYGVYTDVSHFLDWIKSIIELHKSISSYDKELKSTTFTSPLTSPQPKIQRKQRPQNILQQILNW